MTEVECKFGGVYVILNLFQDLKSFNFTTLNHTNIEHQLYLLLKNSTKITDIAPVTIGTIAEFT